MNDLLTYIKKHLPSILVFGVVFFVLGAISVSAQSIDPGLSQLEGTGLGNQDIRVTIANIIRIVLGFLGVLGIGIVLYGGFVYMTAGGNPEKVQRAVSIMRSAVIGLIIIFSSFAIVSFIINALTDPSRGSSFNGPSGPGGAAFSGGLGVNILESHFPERNAVDVPRNTKIFVTFRQPMDAASIIDDQGTPNLEDDRMISGAIRIRRSSDDATTGPFVTEAWAGVTEDLRTFVFDPIELLGSASENTSYTVELTNEILRSNGEPAFGISGNYDWSFEVNTIVDITPPQVESVLPFPDSTNPRNVIVQITFTEAVDPTVSSGKNVAAGGALTSILVSNASSNQEVAGQFSIANQYRTVEFVTQDFCGVNSCGEDVFCLPADANISVLVKSATSQNPPEAQFPYDGIVDAVGNSLDGNADGQVQGPPSDNYSWDFATTGEVDLTPPKVVSLNPERNASNVDVNQSVEATFSKFLQASTIHTGNVRLPGVLNWTLVNNNIEANNSTVIIRHESFTDNADYYPELHAGIRDIYQNCYQPCAGPGCVSPAQWEGLYPSCGY